MKLFYTILKIIILLLFILFAITNTHLVNFNYLPGQAVNLPLIVLLLIIFIIGSFFGILAMFGRVLRLRSQVVSTENELKKMKQILTNQKQENETWTKQKVKNKDLD